MFISPLFIPLQITKKDRDSTSQMLDSKRRELETAITTKRQHDVRSPFPTLFPPCDLRMTLNFAGPSGSQARRTSWFRNEPVKNVHLHFFSSSHGSLLSLIFLYAKIAQRVLLVGYPMSLVRHSQSLSHLSKTSLLIFEFPAPMANPQSVRPLACCYVGCNADVTLATVTSCEYAFLSHCRANLTAIQRIPPIHDDKAQGKPHS